MRTAEEVLDLIIVNDIPFLQHVNNGSELHRLLLFVIRVAQKEAYNEALEDLLFSIREANLTEDVDEIVERLRK